MSAVSALIRETEKLAGIEKLEIYVNNALHTAYLPFSLVDISCQVDAGLLGGRYYQEYLNWACPESVLFDVGVIDRLDPWDFSQKRLLILRSWMEIHVLPACPTWQAESI